MFVLRCVFVCNLWRRAEGRGSASTRAKTHCDDRRCVCPPAWRFHVDVPSFYTRMVIRNIPSLAVETRAKPKHESMAKKKSGGEAGRGSGFSSAFVVDGSSSASFTQSLVLRRASVSMALDPIPCSCSCSCILASTAAVPLASGCTAVRCCTYPKCHPRVCSYKQRALWDAAAGRVASLTEAGLSTLLQVIEVR